MNRPFLLFTLNCSVCGGQLGFVNPSDVAESARKAANNFVGSDVHDPEMERIKEPTGADMVSSGFYVAPCYKCQQPLRDLESGLSKLRKVLKTNDK